MLVLMLTLAQFPDPHIPCYQSMSANSSGRRKRHAGTPPDNSNNKTTKTTSTTAYNQNFEQKLIDHGVYPPEYKYPDGQKPPKPGNWMEIHERLAQPQASLSPSKFSEKHFENFREADAHASKERPVATSVIPTIDGNISDPKCIGGDYLFSNLAPLTDGSLANAKPDHFFGAHPEQLHPEIRKELNDVIIPSTQDSLPMAPNFFLEAKGPDRSPAVATRQACYNGALGARGIHKLQSYKQDEPVFNNRAYTITSTYQAGQLKLYTTHPTTPQESNGRPEYIMSQLKGWSMTSDSETFRNGATAYQNAQDWAKEQQDEFIKSANERHAQAQSELLSSECEATSEPTVVLEDSDTSATSDEAEFHDAAWSFAQPNDSIKNSEASNKNTKRARARANSASNNSLANSLELQRDIDPALREELLEQLHGDTPGFYAVYFDDVKGLSLIAQAVFKSCKVSDNPLYHEESRWQNWPDNVDEKLVLNWLATVINQLVQLTELHDPSQKAVRRPLAQPALIGESTTKQKLNIGFMDDPHATPDKTYNWSQILVLGELKNDRLSLRG
ncbi:hypothetical protein PRK78_006577 [Emydomyces testavorans]|uniref:DUF7924 domain-containing protein n=1 Tax=Emydomyces testavorans TaxID=2070801 RepID=A0AAF0DMR1_9EURO|nr:hypothetical protein PRK78_006577 [Emydomyces testavorans]